MDFVDPLETLFTNLAREAVDGDALDKIEEESSSLEPDARQRVHDTVNARRQVLIAKAEEAQEKPASSSDKSDALPPTEPEPHPHTEPETTSHGSTEPETHGGA